MNHREIAAMVCATAWPQVRRRVVALLERGGNAALEEAAVTLAEAEFRGMVSESESLPEKVRTALRHAGHPLGWLLPRRIEVEREVGVWNFDANEGGSLAAKPRASGVPLVSGPELQLQVVERDASSSLAAFDSIMTESNGRACSLAIEHDGDLTEGLWRSLQSHFEPFAGMRSAEIVPHGDAVAAVLHIAINGGAYSRGAGSAKGRLGAWRTLQWLVTRADRSMEDTVTMVDRCWWVRFSTDSPWFFDIAWDGCYACLNAAERRFAVVAWTDVD
ncbi:MAG: hypothetical protein HEQ23_00585 [Tepidisphaera sp.]